MALILMGALAWIFFLVLVSAATATIFPLVRRAVARIHPAPRTLVLRAIAVAPLALATLGVFLCFAPSMLYDFLPRLDHCVDHSDGHAHFCMNHQPQLTVPAEMWWGLALVAGAGIGILIAQVIRFRRSARLVRQLASTARFDSRSHAWVVDSDVPIAISVGVLRTRTLLSSGLLCVVPPRLVDAIVAHERAHERRRDGLWKLVTEVLSIGHLPTIRREVVSDLEFACEQACDEEAGAVVGDRIQVAEALVAIARARLTMTELGTTALAFGAHGLTARVESLMSHTPGLRCSRSALLGLVAAACVAAAVAAGPLHHATETLVHHVLHYR